MCSQRGGDTLGKQRDAPSSSPAGGSGSWKLPGSVCLCLAPSSGGSSQSPKLEGPWADWIPQEEPHTTKLPFSFYTFYLPGPAFFPKYLLSTSHVADAKLGTQDPFAIIYLELVTRPNEI